MHSTLISQPTLKACLDTPLETVAVDPLCFLVRGWVWLGPDQRNIAAIELWTTDRFVGRTGRLFARPDVASILGLPPGQATGFELFGHDPAAVFGNRVELRLFARLFNGELIEFGSRCVPTIAQDYRRNAYGNLIDRSTTEVHHADTIFASGPSLNHAAPELLDLIRRYLGPPPCRVVDVGCGVGAYGTALRDDGFDWFGVETKAADCAELVRLGLPHRQANGYCLPFPDSAFDAALCLEVLEHVERPHAFVQELCRVAPQRLLVSVPNCELLSYLAPFRAVPWHILEKDHKNYFTRWSLEALLREVYQDVEVRFHTRHPLDTIEGTPLYYHLFATASHPLTAR